MNDKNTPLMDGYELTPWLTPADVAFLMRKTRRTIYNWIRSGQLKAVKAGSTWLVHQKTVEDFLSVPTVSQVSSPLPGGNPLANRKKKNQ